MVCIMKPSREIRKRNVSVALAKSIFCHVSYFPTVEFCCQECVSLTCVISKTFLTLEKPPFLEAHGEVQMPDPVFPSSGRWKKLHCASETRSNFLTLPACRHLWSSPGTVGTSRFLDNALLGLRTSIIPGRCNWLGFLESMQLFKENLKMYSLSTSTFCYTFHVEMFPDYRCSVSVPFWKRVWKCRVEPIHTQTLA